MSFAFNPELNILATVSITERFIKIWDAENAREIKTIVSENSMFNSIIWNKNNTVLICGTWKGEIIYIDYHTGAELERWNAHRGSINSLALSPDGTEFISASFDGTVKKWNVVSAKEILVIDGFNSPVNKAVYSGNGQYLVIACADGTIIKTNALTGQKLKTINAHNSPVHSIVCNNDASIIISGGFDGLIKIWNNEILTHTLNAHNGAITSLDISPDFTRLISSATDNIIIEWLVSNGTKINQFTGHERIITYIRYKNNERFFSSSFDTTVREWLIQNNEEVNIFSGYCTGVFPVKFNISEEYIISGHGNNVTGEDSNLRIWNIKTGSLEHTLTGHKGDITSVSISPDGKKIASSSSDCTVRIWNTANFDVLFILDEHTSRVSSTSFSPDGLRLATGSANIIKIWDTNTGRKITEYSLENSLYLSDLKWRSDGKQIAAAVSVIGANEIILFDLEKSSRQTITRDWSVQRMIYSPDGRKLAAAQYNNTISVWDTATSESLYEMGDGERLPVYMLEFTPCGKYIVSSNFELFNSTDTSLKLWNAETGAFIGIIIDFETPIGSVSFTKDGKRMITSSGDSTIRIWDLAVNEATGEMTGSEILKMIGFTNGEWISITPEGYYVASPNGANYLNVKIGDKVYGMNQYREIFRKPNVVAARLMGRDLSLLGVTEDIREISTGKPEIEILNQTLNDALDTVTLWIVVTDEKENIRKLEFYLNDSLLGDDVLKVLGNSRNLRPESTGISVIGNTQRLVFQIPIPLNQENNRIKIVAHNASGVFGEKTTEAFGKPQEGPPNLWILAIGINHYPHERQKIFHSLNYAVDDAHAFVESFQKQAGPGKPYRTVNARIISDRSGILPTRENIINNLDFLKNRSSNDIIMLFISCHGLNDDDGNFYFIPRDFFTNPDESIPFKDAAVSSDYIRDTLWHARGKKMVFIDACHSGSFGGTNMRVDNSQLVSSLSNESIIIITASKGSELSYELPLKLHGAFTYCFLEGKNGKAVMPGEKEVYLFELFSYVRRNVPREVRQGPQNPWISFPVGYSGDQIMAILD